MEVQKNVTIKMVTDSQDADCEKLKRIDLNVSEFLTNLLQFIVTRNRGKRIKKIRTHD